MKGELRKKQILEASKKIFSTKGGYHEAYVEDVIREAKIGKGTFYQYFKNKEQLFISLLELFLDEWEDSVSQNLRTLETGDVLERMRTTIQSTVEFFYKNEALCKIYLSGGFGFGPVFEPYILKFEKRMIQYVLKILEDGIKSGHIKASLNLELASNIFIGAILRVIYYRFVLQKKEKHPADIRTISNDFFEITMNGILSSQK